MHSFVDSSVAIETIATSAYLETLQSFNNKVIVGSVLAGYIHVTQSIGVPSILANRARQAAWINSSVRKQNAWDTPFHVRLVPLRE